MEQKYREISQTEYQEFFEWLLDRKVEMTKEIDISLARDYEEPYIYYTKEIEEFFKTKPMQRLTRIMQLATSIINNPNAYHTRLEHCKGAYKNALDFWILKFQSSEFKKEIEDTKKDMKLEILADIMYLARHDDCHTMLSHGLEPLLCDGKIKHEEVGKRIFKESEEYKEAINNIKPGLYEKMCENLQKDSKDIDTLKEGNIDFDRMDYLIRDALFLGYPKSREFIEILIRECNIEEVVIDGESKQVPVYNYNALDSIQEFLLFRKEAYRKEYASADRNITDQTLQFFCKKIQEDETGYGQFIKKSIKNYRSKSVEEIDIEQFIEADMTMKIKNKKGDLGDYITINPKSKEEYTAICQEIRKCLGLLDEEQTKGIFSCNRTIKIYNENEPCYIKDKNNQIHTLDKHPDLSIDLRKENVYGISMTPAIMKLENYSQKQIKKVSQMLAKYKKDLKVENRANQIDKDSKVDMGLFKKESTPYIIGL